MSDFILAIPSTTPVYPATTAALQAAYPHSIFPSGLSGLADFHVYPVAPSTPPEYDPATHKAVEITPIGSGSSWTQSWSVEPLTEQELAALNPPQWVQFAIAITQQPDISELLILMRTRIADGGYAQPALADMLSVGLGQASTGFSTATFLAAWQAVMPLMPEGLPETVAALATSYKLPGAFVAALNPS
jgi:hypothetical protein